MCKEVSGHVPIALTGLALCAWKSAEIVNFWRVLNAPFGSMARVLSRNCLRSVRAAAALGGFGARCQAVHLACMVRKHLACMQISSSMIRSPSISKEYTLTVRQRVLASGGRRGEDNSSCLKRTLSPGQNVFRSTSAIDYRRVMDRNQPKSGFASNHTANVLGLVLGCIEADFLQVKTPFATCLKSTKCTHLCTAPD